MPEEDPVQKEINSTLDLSSKIDTIFNKAISDDFLDHLKYCENMFNPKFYWMFHRENRISGLFSTLILGPDQVVKLDPEGDKAPQLKDVAGDIWCLLLDKDFVERSSNGGLHLEEYIYQRALICALLYKALGDAPVGEYVKYLNDASKDIESGVKARIGYDDPSRAVYKLEPAFFDTETP